MDNENTEEVLLKQEIQVELEKCPSFEICAKIKNPQEKVFCVSYVYKQVVQFGSTISEGIGSLEQYLDELHR